MPISEKKSAKVHHSMYEESKLHSKLFHDQIHGYMEISGLCCSIIDTPQFQRLRDLKQLGTLYYVFPGATHNRFEHSLGVSYLAQAMVQNFINKQPELQLTQREAQLLGVAGLVHDLGHGPFSHVFDNEFMPIVRPQSNYCHEEMSLKMLDLCIDENGIDLEKDDVNFVKELVVGAKDIGSKRLDDRDYLYEIVANGKNCVDVDKFDYLSRDLSNLFGGRKNFSTDRLWHYNRVINNEIAYHNSCTLELYELFQQRYQLHKQIYTHRKGKAVEYMVCDAMVHADKELQISASTDTAADFQYMTDHIVKTIEISKCQELRKSRDIIYNIRKRKLYEFVDEYLIPSTLINEIPKVTASEISTHHCTSSIGSISPDDIIVYDGKFNYNLKDKNPVEKVSFYTSANPTVSFHTPKDEVSLLFPDKFEERIIRIYSRNSDPTVKKAILNAFRNYLRQYSTTLPPPTPYTKTMLQLSSAFLYGSVWNKLYDPNLRLKLEFLQSHTYVLFNGEYA